MIKDVLSQSLVDESRDLYQAGDTQSPGSEIRESSRSMRMSSTEQIEVLPDSLDNPEEQKGRENEPFEEGTVSLTDFKKCGDTSSEIGESSHLKSMKSTLKIVQQNLLVDLEELSQTIEEFRLEYERAMVSTVPKSFLSFLFKKKFDRARDRVQKTGCQQVKSFILETIRLKLMVEEKMQELEVYEDTIQTWRSEKEYTRNLCGRINIWLT